MFFAVPCNKLMFVGLVIDFLIYFRFKLFSLFLLLLNFTHLVLLLLGMLIVVQNAIWMNE